MVKGFSPVHLFAILVIISVGGLIVAQDYGPRLAPCTPPNCFGNGTSLGQVGNASKVNPIPDGDNQVKVKFPLFTNTEKLYIDDQIGKIYGQITEKQLPTVLKKGKFVGNTNINYEQWITIYSATNFSRIVYAKEPISNEDPIDGINVGTSPSYTRFYTAIVNFLGDEIINFTSPNSKGKKITLFGKIYTISQDTTASKLILISPSGERFAFKDQFPVLRGINEEIIEGTEVSLLGDFSQLIQFRILTAAPDSDNDFVSIGKPFVDPIFGTFQISYEGLSIIESDNLKRDLISLNSDGGNPHLLVMDTRIDEQNFTMGDLPFVTDVNGTPYLGYGPTKQIRIVEMRDIKKGEYVVVGDHHNGRLLELIDVNNRTSGNGYSDDEVWFIDRLSGTGQSYYATITSEGRGTVNIQGKTYDVTYFDNPNVLEDEYVRLNYPDSPPMEAIFYPVFKTYLGSKIMYYEPVAMNLNTLPQYYGSTIGGPLTLNLPDGEGSEEVSIMPTNITGVYSVITPDPQAETTLDTRPSSDEDKTINFYIGKLSWKLVKDTATLHRALLYLEPVSGVEGINNPALVIFENRSDTGYEALIVKPEFSGPNGAGVLDVETTWGQDLKFDEIQMESKPTAYKSVDRYGTFIWTDRTDSDQWQAGIFYPKEQVYAKVYIQEI